MEITNKEKMENLPMKEAALVYLDRSGGLQKFMDDCKYYNGMSATAVSQEPSDKSLHVLILMFTFISSQIQNKAMLSTGSIF